MGPGKNIVASTRLYGGTVTQFSQTIKRFGWSATFVDLDDEAAVKAAINDDTRALFCESIANPGGHIADLRSLADIADGAGIPLIVDNTTATPYLCNPIEHGATLVVHSTTKYLTGNGTVTGGCVVDSGKFDWSANDKFPSLSAPEPAYHGMKFHETFGNLAFTFHSIAIGLRDLGMTMNPQAAHYTLMGIGWRRTTGSRLSPTPVSRPRPIMIGSKMSAQEVPARSSPSQLKAVMRLVSNSSTVWRFSAMSPISAMPVR